MLGPEHLRPGDLVDVLDRGPPDALFASPVQYRWHATDAKHAISVEPERYSLVAHQVAATPHQPGYSAVTREMIINGFDQPLRAAEPQPEPPLEQDQPEPDIAAKPKHVTAIPAARLELESDHE